ncbi:GNAT family N-acetyltransferase [Thiomicrorhabdus sp. zzn3]|uniref:GNAT family N-acetyltransferase n=1 Tax=Thiomicrorhabdus sp. zzn3 TaxID=3039775 RepID=UPI002436679F|nr:GNAT family N-acetyltransferase [Thiomicrorhabdus sp. zzn3]MDG6777915.1 GNAT family N-acetyltransferase [Thiomicrorhabdus sp. zzn3]
MATHHWHFEFHQRIGEIDAIAWNQLVKENDPFLNHHFLHALEVHECVGETFGWLPSHLAVYQDDKLIGAVPLYIKYNSYGEFVFDHTWAQAWQQVGLPYYPKLVTSVPYSPVTGQRFLTHPDLSENDCVTLLTEMLEQIEVFASQHGMSGWHCLFAEKNQQAWLESQTDILVRHDCHFHWFNQDYRNFDDFLATLTAKKRKNILQERRSIQQSGMQIRTLNGHTATAEDWTIFSELYVKTFTDKWSTPTLNEGFFKEVAQALPDQTVLIMAEDTSGQSVAGALMYRSDNTLFGRHWGCFKEVKNLHFEACYYQGIEYAIKHGLALFEPGAGGEHKIARGFVPVKTRSAHWLTVNPFTKSLQNFLTAEKEATQAYCEECSQHVPYK